MNTETKKSKLVFDMRICRALLKRDMRVIDCKPLKTDKTKTVLVFEDTPEFEIALAEITEEFKQKDETKKISRPIEHEQTVIEGWE